MSQLSRLFVAIHWGDADGYGKWIPVNSIQEALEQCRHFHALGFGHPDKKSRIHIIRRSTEITEWSPDGDATSSCKSQ